MIPSCTCDGFICCNDSCASRVVLEWCFENILEGSGSTAIRTLCLLINLKIVFLVFERSVINFRSGTSYLEYFSKVPLEKLQMS